ncbi:MAG: ATP-binding protein [Chloroflexota bacterium]|nr:ATP-binding protein [Chloroflexota bacterium]
MLNARRRNRSLRVHLTAWYGAAMVALLLLFALLLYLLLDTSLNQEMDRALRVRSEEISNSLIGDEAGGIFTPDPAAESGITLQHDLAVQSRYELALIYGPDGALLEAAGPHPDSALNRAVPAGGRYMTQSIDNANWRLYATPLPVAGGTGTLLVGRSLAGTGETLRQTVWAILVAGPVLLLLACVGGYFLAGRALAPLQRINQITRRIQAQDLGLRIGTDAGTGEIAELAQTIDAMLERLEQAFARQRRFTADAAHELRTPLAVVTAEASLALERRRSTAEYEQVLAIIVQESEQLRVLVQDLLTLARAEHGVELGQPSTTALSAVCAHAIAGVSHQADVKGIQIVVDQTADPVVWGDPIWLGQMLSNLLDNAVKYSRPQGLVQVRLSTAEDVAYLEVRDSGSGIEARHLPHIFERFYRADVARNRDSDTAGIGLGLAICYWIAEAHGGAITVESAPGEGACFTVRLPCAQAEMADIRQGE